MQCVDLGGRRIIKKNFFKQKTAYEISECLVGSEMCIRDSAKGVQTFGNFDCSWSCEWRYFTFWLCPNIELLEETMRKLTEIGDINLFNVQHHYVGRRTAEEFVQ